MDNVSFLIEKLYMEGWLRDEEFLEVLIHHGENEIRNLLAEYARKTAHRYYGNKVYTRGLIEFSNYCRNDCYYCGIRRSNSHAQRYRLKKEDILTCCDEGYNLGFRTFVLQSGEDGYYTDELLIEIITDIKRRYPDCAITLSLGEKEKESYQRYYDAGADRYLLRHETSNAQHYRCLHPKELTSEHRKQCLRDLKAIGFQTGCGIMVGSPSQTLKHIVEDLHFMKELQPEMVGIGPFLPHHDTPFHNEPAGSFTLTLTLISSSSINSVAFSECLLYIYVFPLTFLYCRRDLLRVHIQYASYDWKDILCIRLLHHRYRFYHHTACISFSQLSDC